MTTIEELKKKRFQFLHKLYELSKGDQDEMADLFEDIGNVLGFDRNLTALIGQYLAEESLIEFRNIGDGVSITHLGVREVEEILSNPNKPTKHFPAYNVIYVERMINSQIQQASPGASQLILMPEDKYEELQEIVKSLRESIDKLNLQHLQILETQVEIQTIELQLSSPKPKSKIISECVHSLIRILEGVASNLIAFGYLNKLRGLL